MPVSAREENIEYKRTSRKAAEKCETRILSVKFFKFILTSVAICAILSLVATSVITLKKKKQWRQSICQI